MFTLTNILLFVFAAGTVAISMYKEWDADKKRTGERLDDANKRAEERLKDAKERAEERLKDAKEIASLKLEVQKGQDKLLAQAEEFASQMRGIRSKPVLAFGYEIEASRGYVYISNEGQDPAVDVKGTLQYWADDIAHFHPRTKIGPETVTAGHVSSQIDLNVGENLGVVWIDANIITGSGSKYRQILISVRARRSWSAAYALTDELNNTTKYVVADDFPYEFVAKYADEIRRWAELQEK